MNITFLGAAQEVGRSAFLADSEVSILLDAGMKVKGNNELPHLERIKADALIISHAHLDHSGAAPSLYKHHTLPTFATFPTMPLVNLLWEDSEKIAIQNKQALPYGRKDVQKLVSHAVPMAYNTAYEFYEGTRFRFFDAGHIIGSAQVLVENKKTLLYTGDFKPEATRLHAAAKPPCRGVDALIMESTYAGEEHPDRRKLEKEFCEAVQGEVDNGNIVLVPSFAVGRAQEVMMMLKANSINADVFLDGMAKTVTGIMLDFPSYLKNPELLKQAAQYTTYVEHESQRRAAMKKPGVIITTSGMMDGGPVLSYLKALNEKNQGVVYLTGYQVEGSNGHSFVNGGKIRFNGYSAKVSLPYRQFDFSAHASGPQLVEYAKAVNPQHVYCIHGDAEKCETLARQLKAEGFDASAPKAGDKVNVN